MLFRMYLKWAERKGFETQSSISCPGRKRG
jgi:protein subunit release factor B